MIYYYAKHLCENQPADKRKITGVEHLTELLSHSKDKKPVLLIHRSCTNLITEMESYRWKDPKEGATNVKDRGGLGLGFLIVNYLMLKPLLEIVEVFLSNRHESLSAYLKERRRGRK